MLPGTLLNFVGSLQGLDTSLMRELEETRRAVQEVREFLARGVLILYLCLIDSQFLFAIFDPPARIEKSH